MIVCSVLGMAQTSLDSGYDAVVNSTETRARHMGDNDELTAAGDSTWTYTWYVNTQSKIIADVELDVDSVGGTSSSANAHQFWLSYREFPGQAWINIGDTVTYTGSVDTIFSLTTGETALKANYIRVNCKGKTDSFFDQLYYALLKFWK